MKYLVLCLSLLLLSATVMAQENGLPNDPTTNDQANACYEGGSMEGKCNIDINQDGVISDDEINWAYQCGWYIMRYEEGTISTIPDWCDSLLPNDVPPPCYFNPNFGMSVLRLGPHNQLGNASGHAGPGCEGTGTVLSSSAFIFAGSSAEGEAICSELQGGSYTFSDLTSIGYQDAPSNLYGCDPGFI